MPVAPLDEEEDVAEAEAALAAEEAPLAVAEAAEEAELAMVLMLEAALVPDPELTVRAVALREPHFSLLMHVAWPSASIGWALMHCM